MLTSFLFCDSLFTLKEDHFRSLEIAELMGRCCVVRAEKLANESIWKSQSLRTELLFDMYIRVAQIAEQLYKELHLCHYIGKEVESSGQRFLQLVGGEEMR